MAIKLFYRPTQPDLDIDKLAGKIELLDEKTHMLQRTIEVLLLFLTTSSLDMKEIETNAFKEELEDLALRITSSERPKRIELHFEHRKNKLLSLIEHQKTYIADREKELFECDR